MDGTTDAEKQDASGQAPATAVQPEAVAAAEATAQAADQYDGKTAAEMRKEFFAKTSKKPAIVNYLHFECILLSCYLSIIILSFSR